MVLLIFTSGDLAKHNTNTMQISLVEKYVSKLESHQALGSTGFGYRK